MVEVMKIMLTSFRRPHTPTATLSAPQPCTRPPRTHTSARDSRTVTGKSGSVSCGVPAPFSWVLVAHGSVCALPEPVSPVLGKLWRFCGGLMATSSKKACAIPRPSAPRDPALTAVHCWPKPPQETPQYRSGSVSVGSLGPGAHKICLIPHLILAFREFHRLVFFQSNLPFFWKKSVLCHSISCTSHMPYFFLHLDPLRFPKMS